MLPRSEGSQGTGRARVWGLFCIVILEMLQEQIPMYPFHVKFSHSLIPLRAVTSPASADIRPLDWCRMRTSSSPPSASNRSVSLLSYGLCTQGIACQTGPPVLGMEKNQFL